MWIAEPLVGVEPTTYWLQISCSTNWAKVAYILSKNFQFTLKTPGKLIETQSPVVFLLPHFRTLYFLRDGKGRRFCVMEKFWWSFFSLFSTICKIFQGTPLCSCKCAALTGIFNKKQFKKLQAPPLSPPMAIPELPHYYPFTTLLLGTG